MKTKGQFSRQFAFEPLESRQLLSSSLPLGAPPVSTPPVSTPPVSTPPVIVSTPAPPALGAVPTTDSGAVLHPGAGGSSKLPSGISSSGTLAIANWDTVPFQTFTNQIDVGVVAFHSSGIKEVLFSVNGGAWIAVTTTSVDPQTGANEYWVTLNASNFADGAVTVQAVAIPNSGQAKVLDPITFYSNYHGSLKSNTVYVSTLGSDKNTGSLSSPFQTLQYALSQVTDGGSIIIERSGVYTLAVVSNTQLLNMNNLRWITIEAASNLTANQVTVDAGNDRMITRVQRLEFDNLTLDFSHISMIYTDDLWLNHVTMTMSVITTEDPFAPFHLTAGFDGVYATNSVAIHTVYGFIECTLVRNCDISQITGDALQNSQTIVNCSVHEFYGTAIHHADVYQMWGNANNVIIYGLKAWDLEGVQGLFLQPTYGGNSYSMTNSAFVDIDFSVDDARGLGGSPFSQMQSNFSNILFLRFDSPDQQILLRIDLTGLSKWNAHNIVFEDCIFNPRQAVSGVPGVQFIDDSFGVPLNPDWQPSQSLTTQANI